VVTSGKPTVTTCLQYNRLVDYTCVESNIPKRSCGVLDRSHLKLSLYHVVSFHKHIISWCINQLSELILRSVSGGVTPSTFPYMTDESLTKVHRTPSVPCGPTLRSVSRSLYENLSYPPGVDSERHDTYISYHIHIHFMFMMRLKNVLSYMFSVEALGFLNLRLLLPNHDYV